MWFLQARCGLLFTIINHDHINPNWFFLHSARRGLRGHPYKVRQCARHSRRKGSAFSVRVLKYWNVLSASVVAAPSVNASIKVFHHLLHWLITHTPHFTLPHPFPPAHHPLTIIISICYPTPFSIYVVSSGQPLCHSLLFSITWQRILLGNLLGYSHNKSCLRYIFACSGKTKFQNPCSFFNRFEHGKLAFILKFKMLT